MPYKINVGDPVPEFRVKDHDGYDVSDEDLLGTSLVLFFYPKDATPGCTKEACSFRDQMEVFDKLDVIVLGISSDNLVSHQKFIQENKLDYTLLSDVEKTMGESFGVIKEGKTERSTFLIDANGIIRWIERPVNVEGHVERVVQAIKEHIPKEHRTESVGNIEKTYGEFLKDSLKKKPK
jgi:peroxiredoxin Q/BCP